MRLDPHIAEYVAKVSTRLYVVVARLQSEGAYAYQAALYHRDEYLATGDRWRLTAYAVAMDDATMYYRNARILMDIEE